MIDEAAIHVASGKVREVYALDDGSLALVASDRISTFDVVLPTPIPDKGRVLTGLSAFWFARTRDLVPNHLLGIGDDGRTMVCRRLDMLPIECVVRGYLAGSGWKDYRETGAVCGHALPRGLEESSRLPAPIFTPATKAAAGHDENIDENEAAALVRGRAVPDRARRRRSRSTASAPTMPRRGGSSWPTRSSSSESRRTARRARRRGAHPRLLPVLARLRVRARSRTTLVRQAVRPRLVRAGRLEQGAAWPRATGRRRRRYTRAVRRGVRAPHRDLRSTRISRTRRWSL